MKKISLVIWLMVMLFSLHGQSLQGTSKKNIPPFVITQANGSQFKATDLIKGKAVLMVYFDPDCDHCELFIKELMNQINAFNNIQIILITYVPVESVKKFIAKLGLAKYPGIKVGTEGSAFIVRYHYNVVQFPYLALHDKTGQLFATYESEVPDPAKLAAMYK